VLLGDFLARFDDEAFAAETIMGLGDIALIARLQKNADANDQSLGAYAASAVRRFANDSSDEEWITLMGTLSKAQDPGAAFFECAMDYVLQQDCESRFDLD
jgi:hypothetical protein